MTSGAMLALVLMAVQQPGGAPPPAIQDNSFLIEEAFNQEPGVVQHINTFLHGRGTWAYSFTQEWPLAGQRHQISYTIPVEQGIREVVLNYRQQLAGVRGGTAFAPRLSVLIPTRRGSGTAVQLNLPVSVQLARPFVAHLNAGATATRGNSTLYNAGTSLIWLARPTINAMLEVLWSEGGNAARGDWVINPGLRWAHNVGRLQIIPGISFPDARDLFFYLSLEHPFTS